MIPKFKLLHIVTGLYVTLYKSGTYVLCESVANTDCIAQTFRTKDKARRHLERIKGTKIVPGHMPRVYNVKDFGNAFSWHHELIGSFDEFEIIVFHVDKPNV